MRVRAFINSVRLIEVRLARCKEDVYHNGGTRERQNPLPPFCMVIILPIIRIMRITKVRNFFAGNSV